MTRFDGGFDGTMADPNVAPHDLKTRPGTGPNALPVPQRSPRMPDLADRRPHSMAVSMAGHDPVDFERGE